MRLMIGVPESPNAFDSKVIEFWNRFDFNVAVRKTHGLFGPMPSFHGLEADSIVFRSLV
ncbi:MAG: hypothetical protein O2964_18965 [Verrucomicrobia bacterium]|nr:hypothetical protein [Verrucomicrobiota bacterium]